MIIKSIKSRFSNSKLKKWYTRVFVLGTHWGEFIAEIKQFDTPDTIVLDAGAGKCIYKRHFMKSQYIGMDNGIGLTERGYSNLDIIGDIMIPPIKENSCDIILLIQVLEHIPEPHQTIRKMHGILKKDGKIFITTNCVWHQHLKPYDFFRYTSFGLKYLLEKNGFVVEWLLPMGGSFTCLKYVFSMAVPTLDTMPHIIKVILISIKKFIDLITDYIFSIPVYYLDKLDIRKDLTVGYFCCARKK